MKQKKFQWNQIEELDDKSFSQLIAAAIDVLGSDSMIQYGIKNKPQKLLVQDLRMELKNNNIQTSDENIMDLVLSKNATAYFLKEIAKDQTLADEIEKTYQKQKEMLVVDAGVIAAAALLVLCVKIRKVDMINKVVEFDKIKADILNSIKSFLTPH
jgi:hypothetical protein